MKKIKEEPKLPSAQRAMVLQKVRQMTGQTTAKHKAIAYKNEDGSINVEKLTSNIINNYGFTKYRNQVTEFIKNIFENDKLMEDVLFPKNTNSELQEV